MEAEWQADRALLRQLLAQHPTWSNRQLAEDTSRSVTWVKKWKKRLGQGSSEGIACLCSQSRARCHPPERISPVVVAAILAIRDQPPEELQRTPGPLAIRYYLQRQPELAAAGHRLPTSTSTIWRILDQHQRILRPRAIIHEPLERPAPHQEWQIDFKDVTTATGDTEKRRHQVETLDVVDAGTSLLIANPVRTDFQAPTVIAALAEVFAQHGLPRSVRFDRDPRFVGSASGRDFPAAFVRFLLCLGVEPLICPPHQPQKNPFVERLHRTYEAECLRTKRPATVAEVQTVNGWFRTYYNEQRPHQGPSCGNQPPRIAFPILPTLPTLPPTVDPDAWLPSIRGRLYRRRIGSNGTLHLGRHQYYVGTEYSGQLVAVTIRSSLKFLDVLLGQTIIKTHSLKGLYHQTLSLDDYLHHIGQEAQSEYRLYLASQQRYRHLDAM
jgi:transposase InsO family protein